MKLKFINQWKKESLPKTEQWLLLQVSHDYFWRIEIYLFKFGIELEFSIAYYKYLDSQIGMPCFQITKIWNDGELEKVKKIRESFKSNV
jgi:hypothetical protein